MITGYPVGPSADHLCGDGRGPGGCAAQRGGLVPLHPNLLCLCPPGVHRLRLAGLAGAILAGRRLFGPEQPLLPVYCCGGSILYSAFPPCHGRHPPGSQSLVALWLCTRVLQGAKTRDFIFTAWPSGLNRHQILRRVHAADAFAAFWWAPKRNWAGLFWSLVFVLPAF